MRAIILFAASITAGLSLTSDGDLLHGAILALLGSLYALVTVYEPRAGQSESRYHLAITVGDVLLTSGIVWMTGGITSEYYLLYFMPVVVAAIRLETRAGIAACIAVGCIYPLIALNAPTQPPVIPFPIVRGISVLAGTLVLILFFLLLGRESRLNDDLRDTLHHSLRRVAAVYEVAHAANTGADLTGVLTIILDHAARATNAVNGSLLLLSDGDRLNTVASLYTPAEATEATEQPPMEPAHEAVRTALPVTVSVAHQGAAQPASVVYVPLQTPAGPLGVLALVTRPGKRFARRHLDFLMSLCSEAALAIENAQLRSELRRLAVTDSLTGLPNRREVGRHLGIELERAARHHRSLSLMMLDVDDLKDVNDEYGHAAGDEVLIALARLMQQTIRSSDIVGRIGGDEFMVVLAETESRQSVAVAERLIEGFPDALRTWPNLPDADRIAGAVGISIGIAGSEDEPLSSARLMARADSALYEAKRAGKNRVCTAAQQSALR